MKTLFLARLLQRGLKVSPGKVVRAMRFGNSAWISDLGIDREPKNEFRFSQKRALMRTRAIQCNTPNPYCESTAFPCRMQLYHFCITAAFRGFNSPTYKWFILYGELAGNRTQDPRLKRALLYQLSYELIIVFNLFIFNKLKAIQFFSSRGLFGVGSQFVATLYRNRPRTNQGFQRLRLVSRREVGIPGGHSDRLVSHQFLHCL